VAYLRERVPLLDVPKRLAHDRLAGFLYASARFGNIFVEQGDRLTRRRFSVAHELGHFTLHVLPYFAAHRDDPDAASVGIVEALPTDAEGEEGGQLHGQMMLPGSGDAGISDWAGMAQRTATETTLADERLELEANRFAAELLMSADVVAQLVERHGAQFRGADLISRLASDLLVSRAAVELRLHDLGLRAASRSSRYAPGLN
jgi:Zn-dependent peptidase ImmA (M78 family)